MSTVDDLTGTWSLLSYTVTISDREGERRPYGEHPVGLLYYSADGWMSAQLMAPDRPGYDAERPDGGTAEQYTAAAEGFIGYAGPFDVDEDAGVVRHHVRVSLLPNWVGGVQVRRYELTGGTLTLRAETPLPDGRVVAGTLRWQRAERHEMP
jgi:hypothetical protein